MARLSPDGGRQRRRFVSALCRDWRTASTDHDGEFRNYACNVGRCWRYYTCVFARRSEPGVLAHGRTSNLMFTCSALRRATSHRGNLNRFHSTIRFNFGLTWTPNGSEIVFSSGRWFSAGRTSELWRKAAWSSAKPRKLAFATDDTSAPAISRQGDRLAYAVERSDANIWRVDLHGPDRIAGSPFQFISSTRMEFHPAYSPDGKRIAFSSTGQGHRKSGCAIATDRTPVQLTSFGGER